MLEKEVKKVGGQYWYGQLTVPEQIPISIMEGKLPIIQIYRYGYHQKVQITMFGKEQHVSGTGPKPGTN